MTSPALREQIAWLRRGLRKAGWRVGLDVRVYEQNPGASGRPIGDMELLLQDVRARGFSPQAILDIGANRGDWSRLAGTVFPSAKFLLIEPQPEMDRLLRDFCRSHQGSIFVAAGAGAKDGELTQTIWDDLAGSSFLPPVDPALVAKGKQRTVPIVAIDTLLDVHPQFKPDLVKIDVQGFELEVLRGAQKLFRMAQLFIIEASLFEFMPGQPLVSEIVGHMHENGYELYDVAGYMRRPSDGALGQLDLVFAAAAGSLRSRNSW